MKIPMYTRTDLYIHTHVSSGFAPYILKMGPWNYIGCTRSIIINYIISILCPVRKQCVIGDQDGLNSNPANATRVDTIITSKYSQTTALLDKTNAWIYFADIWEFDK